MTNMIAEVSTLPDAMYGLADDVYKRSVEICVDNGMTYSPRYLARILMELDSSLEKYDPATRELLLDSATCEYNWDKKDEEGTHDQLDQ